MVEDGTSEVVEELVIAELEALELEAEELEATELEALELEALELELEELELETLELEALELEALELELAVLEELTELEVAELLLEEVAELEALEEELTLPPWSETACLKASTAVLASSPGHLEFKQSSILPLLFSPLQTTWFIESQSESLFTSATQAKRQAGGVAKTPVEKRANEATADKTEVVRILD